VEAVLDGLRDFRRVIAEGTMEEKKAFVRAFIPGITLDPRDRSAVIRIRRFPLPNDVDSGNRAVRGVAGAEKNEFDDAREVEDLIATVFGVKGSTLVPA
jgi:hypothetical protein